MSYTSGAPRNVDPAPWRVVLGPWSNTRVDVRIPDTEYEPRPDYALPPRDDANPYLQAFRDYLGSWAVPSPVLAREWLALPTLRDIPRGSHLEPDVTQATSRHALHATLVLLRIAELDRAVERERASNHE